MKKILSLLLAVILAFASVVGLMFGFPQPVAAATTLTVNTTSDSIDDQPNTGADLATDEGDGSGLSLREAIFWASVGDTVTFAAGLSGQTITLSGTQLTIDKDITLDGDLNDDGTPDITISGNSTSRVIYTDHLTATASLEGLIITNGSGNGAGMYNAGSSPTISNCTFSENSGYWGGGMNNTTSSPTITDCTFSENSANIGGGLYNKNSSPTIINCNFSDNFTPPGETIMWGGAMYNVGSSPTISNCTFSGNSAVSAGGVMYNYSSTPNITNCTFSGNSAASAGGVIYNNSSTPNITNCILWGDTVDEIQPFGSSVVEYSNVQGGYAGTGNISADPLFVNAAGGDFHLQSEAGHWTSTGWVLDAQTSPCIDAGNPASAYNNEPVPNGERINMGAYGNTSQASKSAPEINLKEGVTDIANGGSYDFGSQLTGTDTDVTFTIENTGTIDLTLTTPITLGGVNADQFSIQTQPTSPVAAAGSTTFTVRFTPTSAGAKAATISIANNDSNENPYDFSIQGTGLAPEMNLKEGVTDIADDGSYDFGSQLLNTNMDVTFTIENTGTVVLTLTTPLTITGINADQFSIQTDPASSVAASGNTTFVVRFTPTSVDAKTATISITNNDSDENPYDFTIQGTGLAPEMDLKQDTTNIADDSSYAFGSQLLNTNTDVTFTIENTGTSNLTLTTPLTIGGANEDQFSIQTQPTSPVAASGSTTFVVRFTPTSIGAKTATVSIANNDDDENPYDLTITGTGFVNEEPEHYLRMNLLGTRQRVTTSSSGRLRQTLEVTFADGTLTVTIPSGTRAKQENGNRLTTLSVIENDNPPPPPENKCIIGLPYSFEPSGATFDPPITLTFHYEHADIPNGVIEEDLVLAFYDEDTGEWIECACTCDPDTNCIIACIYHFTDFAIIAPVPPPPPPPAKPAVFSLSKLTIQPLEVEPEEMVTITVSVANTGSTAGSYTVVLDINGAEEQTQSISITAGGTKEVDFTVDKEDPGDYSIKIGSLEGTFTVMVPTEPAETPVEEVPQQPELPAESTPAVEEGGVNWYIVGTLLGVAVLLAIFIPIWIRRRRAG